MKFITEPTIHNYLTKEITLNTNYQIGEIYNFDYHLVFSELSEFIISAIKRNDIILFVVSEENRIIHILDHQNINEFIEKYLILL